MCTLTVYLRIGEDLKFNFKGVKIALLTASSSKWQDRLMNNKNRALVTFLLCLVGNKIGQLGHSQLTTQGAALCGGAQHKRAILQKYQTFYLNQDQQHWWQYHWSCIVCKFFTQTLFGNQQEKFTFCYEYYFLLVCPKCRRFPFWWLNWVWKGKVAPLLVLPSSTMDLSFCCFFTSWIFTHPRTSITHHHRHPSPASIY